MRAQFIEPMLATPVEQPPDGDGWIQEIKHDGYGTHEALTGGDAAQPVKAVRRLVG